MTSGQFEMVWHCVFVCMCVCACVCMYVSMCCVGMGNVYMYVYIGGHVLCEYAFLCTHLHTVMYEGVSMMVGCEGEGCAMRVRVVL